MNSAQPLVPISHCTGTRAAVGLQLIAALAVAHRVDGAAAIELRAAFAEPEERRVAGQEVKGAPFVDEIS